MFHGHNVTHVAVLVPDEGHNQWQLVHLDDLEGVNRGIREIPETILKWSIKSSFPLYLIIWIDINDGLIPSQTQLPRLVRGCGERGEKTRFQCHFRDMVL